MSILRFISIVFLLLPCTLFATGDDTGTVSIVGKNVDSSDPKTKDSQAAQLLPIDPVSAKKGDHGTGESEETGIAFSWNVN